MTIVKLPRGGALYSAAEIKQACDVIHKVRSDYERAVSDATEYADAMWSKLPIWKRLNRRVWWDWYHSAYRNVLKEYKGTKLVSTLAPYGSRDKACNELLQLEKANRDCFLNPDQIQVVSLCNK